MDPITFSPIYKERVWGGQTLKAFLGRDLPDGSAIGESWDIVDRDGDNSLILNGQFKGKTLREAINEAPEAIMGKGWDPKQRFPILVKWLDCQETLSVQVHPPQEVAESLGGEPKSENWVIVQTQGDSAIYMGLNKAIEAQGFKKAIDEGTLEELLKRVPTAPGDHFSIPSGTIHAIGAGNLILEIQQNSDTTYRLYDWNRVGLDGKPRDLHIEESLKSIDLEHAHEKPKPHNSFEINKISLNNKKRLEFKNSNGPAIVSVVGGKVVIAGGEEELVVSLGGNVLLPSGGRFNLEACEDSSIVVTDKFNSN